MLSLRLRSNLLIILFITLFSQLSLAAPQCTDLFEKEIISVSLEDAGTQEEIKQLAGYDLSQIAEVESQKSKKNFDLYNYYYDKLRELKEINKSAPYAVILRGLIMATTKSKDKTLVPLKDLYLIHPISHVAAIEKLQKRIAALKELRPAHGSIILTSAILDQKVSSKNLMRAIQTDDGGYVVFDGNGRLAAIQEVFGGIDTIVEVEVYRTRSRLAQYFLKRVRQIRGMLPPESETLDSLASP